MLQRIQTIFMLIAFIALVLGAYLGFDGLKNLYALGFGFSGILVLINIFLYKNRPLQVKLNYLVILLILILSGLSIYQSGIVSGERSLSKKDIEWLIPLVSIVFLLTANKYIKRDEALVKSVDRIR
jgi:hypothetical protein